MRAFLAIEIPEELKLYLQTVIDHMAPRAKGIKWVKKDGQHITLKFFGEIEETTALQIKGGISAIEKNHAPFTVSIKGIDAFPGRRRARVIVVTLAEGAQHIKDIFSDIEKGLSKMNIEAEAREYTPHITIGRARTPMPLLDKDIMALEEKRFFVDKVVLFQSTLTKEGAIYTPQWDIKLGGRE
ncbi:MAG: RNA 2',3'-cyclic phosphodiesterase [Syntrophus sp. (in: bacteria)]|nr:RNA 2',3'-cyclic phosphodiesterase [Syntrophus sp. (in: bacteria)]